MKTKLLALALVLPSMGALANNTVTFYGQVTDATCNVTTSSGTGDVSVQLDTVQASALATDGATTGKKDFTFTISGCNAGDSSKKVGIRLVPTNMSSSGNLSNVAPTNAAANVEVQLLDGDTAIDFTNGEHVSTLQNIPATADGSVEVPFKVQYYSTGTAGVGKVQASVQYALAYE